MIVPYRPRSALFPLPVESFYRFKVNTGACLHFDTYIAKDVCI